MTMTTKRSTKLADLSGGDLDIAKMPGRWLLNRLGKRVLRPGGLGLTQLLLDGLSIGPSDEVIEFAPGFGVTARLISNRFHVAMRKILAVGQQR